MNMMMVKASMFPRTSFGIPWSSGRMISYWYEECEGYEPTHCAGLGDEVVKHLGKCPIY
jgi:hypothetical protein